MIPDKGAHRTRETLSRSSAGCWYFDKRRWLDTTDLDDLAVLQNVSPTSPASPRPPSPRLDDATAPRSAAGQSAERSAGPPGLRASRRLP